MNFEKWFKYIETGKWVHLAIIENELYLDGKLVARGL